MSRPHPEEVLRGAAEITDYIADLVLNPLEEAGWNLPVDDVLYGAVQVIRDHALEDHSVQLAMDMVQAAVDGIVRLRAAISASIQYEAVTQAEEALRDAQG